jgi:ABC-type sugar transport system permease subunit
VTQKPTKKDRSTPALKRNPMTRRAKRDAITFAVFTFPNFLLLTVFVFWPIFYSLYLSFFKWDMVAPTKKFIGLDNFKMMFNDPVFWLVTKNTLVLSLYVVIVKLGIALGLALVMNRDLKGRSLYQAIIFSPTFTTSVAVAMVWRWILEPDYGLLRVFMRPLGIPPLNWIESQTHSLPAVIIVLIWVGIGYDMVIFLAGLKNIPPELYDAGLVDGVTPLQEFIHITFPLLSPTTFFLTITGFISALKAFDIISILTAGGPLNTSNVLVHFLYQNAFQWFKTGYASALALLLFIIIMTITLIQNRLSKRWVHY